MKIKIMRVKKDDFAIHAIEEHGCFSDNAPADGFLIKIDSTHSLPLFVRDEDIDLAKARYEEKGRSINITAKSWGDEGENSNLPRGKPRGF